LQSIHFQLDQRVIVNYYKACERLKIPGLGQIKVRWTRVPEGLPKMVTVIKDSAGRYFVSMAVEEDIQSLPAVGKTVGIDLGVNQVDYLNQKFSILTSWFLHTGHRSK
jgi:putative transposase